MERLPSMNPQEIASRDLITQRTIKSRSSLALPLTPPGRPPLLETSIDSTSTTSTPRDLNGMKFAVSRSKIITQLLRLAGNTTVQESELVHFVDQLMCSTFASKNPDIKENLNLLMCPYHKLLSRTFKMDKDSF